MSGLSHVVRAARGALRLPSAAALASKGSEKVHAAHRGTLAAGRAIMVVSPDTARGAMLQRLIAVSGYAAAVVPGDAVREQVTRVRPIAVLVDATCLPLDEAVSLVGALRQDVEGPLIGVVDSHDDNGDACVALLDAGADDVVRGSIAAPELRARLYAHGRPRRMRTG